uniref:Uncharacterized protein n=1 Tax=Mola mola TaxID=94237 RepID=A0A3Q4BM46_MOLML
MSRQGQVGDLSHQGKEELQELLLRQEKILSNKRLLQTLPDKGEKIKEFVEKVRLALEHHDEKEKRQSVVCAARTELQSKYQQAFTMQQRAIPNTPAASHQIKQSDAAAGEALEERGTLPALADVQENTSLDEKQAQFVSTVAAGAPLNANETKEGDLAVALERMRLSESRFSSKSKHPLHSTGRDNVFAKQVPKKPHYITILEKSEMTPAKPNLLNQVSPSDFSHSSGGSSPLSAQARREQDRKHLVDVTAANLPPLHHSPAQLLSLEESVTLQMEQKKKYDVLQARLAALKLSEGLKMSMGSYTADGGAMAAYRDVHDEGALLSSEED